MKTRIITGIGIAAGFVLLLAVGGNYHIMTIAMAVVGAVGAWEIIHATNGNALFETNKSAEYLIYAMCALAPLAVLGKVFLVLLLATHLLYIMLFITSKENNLPFFGYSYIMIILLSGALYSASFYYNQHMYYLIFFVLLSIGTDVFAYFTGYFLGKRKLIPWVSPNKTVEGAIGGVLGAIALSYLGAVVYNKFIGTPIPETLDFINNPLVGTVIIILLSILSQFGDLFYSKIKRYFGTKDYGVIFPGHGGILDRLDGVIFVSFTFLLIMVII